MERNASASTRDVIAPNSGTFGGDESTGDGVGVTDNVAAEAGELDIADVPPLFAALIS